MKPEPLVVATDPQCAKCRGAGYRVVRAGELAKSEICGCVGRCPLCGGTGWVAMEAEPGHPGGRWARRRRCACQVLPERVRRFNEAGIPARHADSRIGNFDPQGKAELIMVLKAIKGWLVGFEPGKTDNRGMVLHGDVGRGKTHLMVGMLRDLVFTAGVTVRFVEFSHLLSEIKSGFDAGRGASELLDPLVAVEVLAIDELGKGRNTEFEQTVIDELVSRRYNAMAPILSTTNYGPGEATGRAVANAADVDPRATQPLLADRIGSRVYSRLREICDFVGVPGEDHREKLHTRKRT